MMAPVSRMWFAKSTKWWLGSNSPIRFKPDNRPACVSAGASPNWVCVAASWPGWSILLAGLAIGLKSTVWYAGQSRRTCPSNIRLPRTCACWRLSDLPLSGVFGAGKTRSAAILVVGLLVFEPGLKLMILTKENVAAQAFAEHIESFGLPEFVTSKIGWLVGYMELKKNKTNKTSLDVTCENRHEMLKQKYPNWMWWRLLTRMFTVIQSSCYVDQRSIPYPHWRKSAVRDLRVLRGLLSLGPNCILHLWLLSYQPRITPNKHCATVKRLHKRAVAGCWQKVGHLCLLGYFGYGIFGRRTSERMRACPSSMRVFTWSNDWLGRRCLGRKESKSKQTNQCWVLSSISWSLPIGLWMPTWHLCENHARKMRTFFTLSPWAKRITQSV